MLSVVPVVPVVLVVQHKANFAASNNNTILF